MPLHPELTGLQFADQILLEVNKATDDTARSLVIEYLIVFQEKGAVKPVLQKLYAKRELLSWLIGQNAGLIDWTEAGVTEKHSGIVHNYQGMLEAVQTVIDSVEKQVGSTIASMGSISATVPAPTVNGRFPANSPYLLGDPNYPHWRRR